MAQAPSRIQTAATACAVPAPAAAAAIAATASSPEDTAGGGAVVEADVPDGFVAVDLRGKDGSAAVTGNASPEAGCVVDNAGVVDDQGTEGSQGVLLQPFGVDAAALYSNTHASHTAQLSMSQGKAFLGLHMGEGTLYLVFLPGL